MHQHELTDDECAKFCALVYRAAGIRIADNKRVMVGNRVRRRLRATGIASFKDYFAFLTSPAGAGESLARIVQGVEETAASITKIAQATREQAEASAEVNKAIQNVSSITETNASSSEELSASAEVLGAQAATLKHVISGFKV